MKKYTQIESVIEGSLGKKISLDITKPISKTATPVLIFCHGFKGFKDWGHFNWVAQKCTEYKISFLKFNFSHNGVLESQLNDISDLEAFSSNNYTTELNDLDLVINWVEKNAEEYQINPKEIYLMGHSRGGGIALLKASEDIRIKKLVLWAALSEFDSFFRPETIADWQKNGVVYAENKRTGQQLPLKKQFYDNYLSNKVKLDIPKAAKILSTPLLILHGDQDESVDIKHAEKLYEWVKHSILIKMEGANHTFGAKHPFNPETDVTETLEELLENTFEFLVDDISGNVMY
ncbi:MAG: alpha/beta hydrolase fold domain-containing protein [Bacteroidota bacterium]|nr:alpha/beta hydrolase fold domain-containing protein [Bacteroidota bacterium]